MSIKDRLMTYAEVLEHESMKKHTTFKIGGFVDYYIYPKNCTALMCVLEILAEENIPYYVLGRGSNVLCSDTDFNGAIINLDRTLNDFYFEPDGILVAQAGCSIINMAVEAMKRSLTGLEWASGIPGTLGGGIYGNCGAYKECIFDYLEEIIVLHNGKIEHMKKEKVAYDYRTSFFKNKKQYVIVAARLKLKPGNKEAGQEIIADRLKRRMASQPLTYPSAGSVFRNPAVDIYAGKLIEDCNLKGYKIGGAEVSNKHANFIVNTGGATAKDIITIINYLKKTIKDKYDIDLILEQEIVNWE